LCNSRIVQFGGKLNQSADYLIFYEKIHGLTFGIQNDRQGMQILAHRTTASQRNSITIVNALPGNIGGRRLRAMRSVSLAMSKSTIKYSLEQQIFSQIDKTHEA